VWAHPPAVSRLIAADLVSSQAGTEILKTGLSWVSVFETNLSSIQFRYDIKTWINDAQVNKERIHKPILGILFWERIGRLCLDTYSVQHGVLCYVNQCLWRRWLRQFSNPRHGKLLNQRSLKTITKVKETAIWEIFYADEWTLNADLESIIQHQNE